MDLDTQTIVWIAVAVVAVIVIVALIAAMSGRNKKRDRPARGGRQQGNVQPGRARRRDVGGTDTDAQVRKVRADQQPDDRGGRRDSGAGGARRPRDRDRDGDGRPDDGRRT